MSTIQRITKNTMLLVVSNIIGKAITFFYTLIAVRYLSYYNYGALSLALAFAGIFAILDDLGLSRVQIREIARNKANASNITTNILFLKLFLGVATFLLLAAVVNLMNYPQDVIMLVYITGLSIFFTNFGASFESVFQGFEEMSYMGIAHILNTIILLAGAIFVVNTGGGVIEFALVYLASSIIVVAFDFIVSIKKFIKISIGVDLKFCRYVLKEALPFALSDMLLALYFGLSNIFLSIFQGEAAVSFYNVPYNLVDSLNLVYSSFTIALFPVTSRLFKYSKEKLMLSFEKSVKYLLITSIPIAVGTTLLSDKIIQLYDVKYAPYSIVLQILVWFSSLAFINTAASNLLSSIDKQAAVAKQNAMAAVINIMAGLLLIPQYSYVGASIAAVITQLFSMVYLYYVVSRTEFKLPQKTFLILLLKVASASIIMGIFVAYLRFVNIFLVVPLSALLYFSSFYLLGGIDSYDIEIAKDLVGKFLKIKLD
jgi:O-antigen/teichoic acid export membrane protein